MGSEPDPGLQIRIQVNSTWFRNPALDVIKNTLEKKLEPL